MKRDEFWKSISLGLEVDASGTFIYNGIKTLEDIENLNNSTDIFEILYCLSVGLERLFKVAIILYEHDDQKDMIKFEKSLLTHNTQELLERVNKHKDLKLSNLHSEFTALLSKFYKSHRYGRYLIDYMPSIDVERKSFLAFIGKHLKLDFEHEDSLFPILNTDQIRKFVGKIVKNISGAVFSAIKQRADELNVYTYEIRSDSKALKVFYGKRLDFIEERQKKKELLLYLLDPKTQDKHLDILKEIGGLDLDSGMIPSYIKAILNDRHLPYVEEIVDCAYAEVKDVGERLRLLEIVDSDGLFDPEEDFEVEGEDD